MNIDHSIVIKPVNASIEKIKKNTFAIIPDYLETGTYFAIGAGADNSEITIKNCVPKAEYVSFSNEKFEFTNDTLIHISNKDHLECRLTVDPDRATVLVHATRVINDTWAM